MDAQEGIVIQKDDYLTLGDHYDQYLSQLKTYEDYLSFYSQLDEASSAFSWVKADVLHQMTMNLGEKSLESLAADLKQPRSTVANYVRVARAFPPDKRLAIVPFSTHYQASYADSYDEKTKTFSGEERFALVQKAADENLSVRQVIREMKSQKLLAQQTDAELVKMIGDAEQMSHSVQAHFGVLRDKVKAGDKDAFEKLHNEYQLIFPITTS